MKIKKSIVFLFLAVVVIVLIWLTVSNQRLQNRLSDLKAEQTRWSQQMQGIEELRSTDSLLLKGEYATAIASYTDRIKTQSELNLGIPLRIALAEKLLQERQGNRTDNATDSLNENALADRGMDAAEEVEKLDSLNFRLEKTKVQLAQLKKQVQEKSFGEYLQFTSNKGDRMHYVGQVKNGKANGYGIALLDTGSRFEGEWKDNQRHGEGSFYWADGEVYKGHYENDKRNGFGIYSWPNGEKYAGDWKNDKRNGKGKFYDENGSIVTSGLWKEDKLVQEDKDN